MADEHGLSAAVSRGQIVPAPDVDIPVEYPTGTETTRCTVCNETRYHIPNALIDPWKKHYDYCPEDLDTYCPECGGSGGLGPEEECNLCEGTGIFEPPVLDRPDDRYPGS